MDISDVFEAHAPSHIDTNLRELWQRATPGKWFPGHLCNDNHSCNCAYIFSEGQHGMGAIATIGTDAEDVKDINEAKANQALIPAAVNALPILLDELDAARARIAELEKDAGRLVRTANHVAEWLTRYSDQGQYRRINGPSAGEAFDAAQSLRDAIAAMADSTATEGR